MVRVSDAERDDVLDRLREAHAQGRLDSEEFTDRAGRTLLAKTVRDLQQLTEDLPSPAGGLAALQPHAPVIIGPARLGLLIMLLGCCLVLLLSGPGHGGSDGLWPVWLVFWSVLLFRRRHPRRHPTQGMRQQPINAGLGRTRR